MGLCDAAIQSMAFGGISRGGTGARPGEARDGSSHRSLAPVADTGLRRHAARVQVRRSEGGGQIAEVLGQS